MANNFSITESATDLAKTFDGYGTALKPAYEPIILAMKPLDGTFAQNAEKWGVAGINIDECRIPIDITTEAQKNFRTTSAKCGGRSALPGESQRIESSPFIVDNHHPESLRHNAKGRWPANLILDEAAAMLDQQSGIEASRFFYCAKSSSAERNAGLEGMPFNDRETSSGNNRTRFCSVCNLTDNGQNNHSQCNGEMINSIAKPSKNNHPTVKPLALMRYLIKLIMPPNPDAILLDPFAGSGSTIVAAKQLRRNAIGIEIFEEYAEIARKRLENTQLPIEQFEFAYTT